MTTTPVHTITDEQIAEIEKAAKDKKAEGFLLTHNLSCDNLIALVSRLREAEKDAERYRWLRDEALNIDGWAPAVVITDGGLISQCLDGRDLDEEIDVYMQEHKQ